MCIDNLVLNSLILPSIFSIIVKGMELDPTFMEPDTLKVLIN